MRRPPASTLRAVAGASVGALLLAALWFRRAVIGDAVHEIGSMAAGVVAFLVVLGVLERVVRADILRRLLGRPTFGRALTIHDVGTAASKGIPLGGPLATALRWSIARDASIPTTTFAAALVAYGVATTYVTWLLPFGWLATDALLGSPSSTDVVALGVCLTVLAGSTAFWATLLCSDRVADRVLALVEHLGARAARRVPALAGREPAAAVAEVRTSLRRVGRRPVWLLMQTAIAQSVGAVILWVALRGVGVGAELGVVEFARVYFVVTLLSSFVPVPGGVGVVEAGLTAALVAAGVEPSTALAGVLVYRLLTYVAPIAVGTVLYVGWRCRSARSRSDAPIATGNTSTIQVASVPCHLPTGIPIGTTGSPSSAASPSTS